MGPDDLLCPRNARSKKDVEGAARCPSCSQNAHGEAVLDWDKSASRRAQGWVGENVARGEGQPGHSLERGYTKICEKNALDARSRDQPFRIIWKVPHVASV